MASWSRTIFKTSRQVVHAEFRLSRHRYALGARQSFHSTPRINVIKPFLLADIGEGTTEAQIIQWFVQPGARVEQFDKICEVQSDKAATDITSPFDGVITKLYYDVDADAIVGKVGTEPDSVPDHVTNTHQPLVDIDIQSDIEEQDEALLGGGSAAGSPDDDKSRPEQNSNEKNIEEAGRIHASSQSQDKTEHQPSSRAGHPHRSLATPAVRHLIKELKVDIKEVEGTGKDGRVLKEDVQRHASRSTQEHAPAPSPAQPAIAEDRKTTLTPVQNAMFKTMTRSLTIPHFLYTSTVDTTALTALRQRINAKRSPDQKLTPLPFILKAVSLAFAHHALLNASLDTSDPKKLQLTYRASHDFGMAVDTPSGLLVPVIRAVQSKTVLQIAAEIRALGATAREGELKAADFQGVSFTASNIGSIGGGVLAPIIVEPQVAIVGIGRGKIVPAFDEHGHVVKREEVVLSWSADHRVVDGAECARAAERVKRYLENVEEWVLEMSHVQVSAAHAQLQVLSRPLPHLTDSSTSASLPMSGAQKPFEPSAVPEFNFKLQHQDVNLPPSSPPQSQPMDERPLIFNLAEIPLEKTPPLATMETPAPPHHDSCRAQTANERPVDLDSSKSSLDEISTLTTVVETTNPGPGTAPARRGVAWMDMGDPIETAHLEFHSPHKRTYSARNTDCRISSAGESKSRLHLNRTFKTSMDKKSDISAGEAAYSKLLVDRNKLWLKLNHMEKARAKDRVTHQADLATLVDHLIKTGVEDRVKHQAAVSTHVSKIVKMSEENSDIEDKLDTLNEARADDLVRHQAEVHALEAKIAKLSVSDKLLVEQKDRLSPASTLEQEQLQKEVEAMKKMISVREAFGNLAKVTANAMKNSAEATLEAIMDAFDARD